MKQIYSSNRMEHLCDILAKNIKESKCGVFDKELIVTQTAGMNAWLKTELAERNGVLAQFEFQNPDGLFGQIYKLLFNESAASRIDDIKFQLYSLLDRDVFKADFPEVSVYYSGNEKRRYDLAGKIADLFDQYQLYRPEMINAWKNNQTITENPAENWQQSLWQTLNISSKDDRKQEMIKAFGANQALIRKHFPEISFFGLSIYTNFHLEFFDALSEFAQVNFYLCLPAKTEEPGNELFNSLGTKAKELIRQFEPLEWDAIPSDKNSLLGQLQNLIHNNQQKKFKFNQDKSIQISSCYTPAREVECLYNYLLDLFVKDPSLRPRDVLVMTTDINKYAPFVKAVFRNAPVNIPFQVSGAANNSGDTIVAALEQLLTFTQEDFTAERIVSLLEQNRIKQRFQVTDCGYIRSVVNKANIRFGIQNKAEDDSQYVSWECGLEKILLGYAMLTDEEFDGKYPFKDAEASASYDLFRLKAFVEKLSFILEAEKLNRTLAEWKLFLFNEVLANMIYQNDYDKDDRAEISSIYRALSYIDLIDMDEPVPFALFLLELKSKLFTESFEQKLNTGRVTVSSAIPVRGLPYKLICFIGLDNDLFPRQDRFMGFDLLGENYLEGDRSVKDTDKYLFLDTLLAAREKLYLSYIGQSSKDNTEIPPTIVLDTLMDYIGIKAEKHPLHGFSFRYQKDHERLFTYLYAPNANTFESKEPEQKKLTELSVYSFVKFFDHPIEWYFNTMLGIKYDDNDDALPETELFELNHLQQWFIKNDLLRLPDSDLANYLNKSIKEGKLPLKNLGKITVDKLLEEISKLREQYQMITTGKDEQHIVIDLLVDDVHITGTINSVYEGQYVSYAFSDNPKHKVKAWLNTLLLCAQGNIDKAIYLDPTGGENEIPIIDMGGAIEKLKELLKYIKEGSVAPLKFTLKAITEKGESIESVLKSFYDEAYPNEHNPYPRNKYLQLLFEEDYFNGFDETDLEKIKTLAYLINLKTA